MRNILFFFLMLGSVSSFAQSYTITFDTLSLGPDTAYVNYNNPMTDVGFNDGPLHFPCYYDTAYGGYWSSGFSYSNKKDSVNGGLGNQYASRAGGGALGTPQYAVAYGTENGIWKNTFSTMSVASMYFTNTTYAYNSMRDGDAFAKKFGGPSGTDPDYLRIKVSAYRSGAFRVASYFYLADFRFADSSQDYILKDWKSFNLVFGPNQAIDSMHFTLESSDTGAFGINTPAYFCLDEMSGETNGIERLKNSKLKNIFPNPAKDFVQVSFTDFKASRTISIYNMGGALVKTQVVINNFAYINISSLPSSNYLLSVDGDMQGAKMFSKID